MYIYIYIYIYIYTPDLADLARLRWAACPADWLARRSSRAGTGGIRMVRSQSKEICQTFPSGF